MKHGELHMILNEIDESRIDELVNLIRTIPDEGLQAMIDYTVKENQLYMRDILLIEQDYRLTGKYD